MLNQVQVLMPAQIFESLQTVLEITRLALVKQMKIKSVVSHRFLFLAHPTPI